MVITNTSNGIIVNGPGIVNVENSMHSFNGTGVNANANLELIEVGGAIGELEDGVTRPLDGFDVRMLPHARPWRAGRRADVR